MQTYYNFKKGEHELMNKLRHECRVKTQFEKEQHHVVSFVDERCAPTERRYEILNCTELAEKIMSVEDFKILYSSPI